MGAATVYNLDWPSKAGLLAATQKAQLRAICSIAARELKLNALLFQVCARLPTRALRVQARGRGPSI